MSGLRLCKCGCGEPVLQQRRATWRPGHDKRLSPHEYLVDPETGCWVWQRGMTRRYAITWVEGKTRRASRVYYERENGPVPQGMCVCHSCDNPSCVNPEHLFLGTSADNSRDMAVKGRGRQRLSAPEVVDIRRRADNGETKASIARVYGVSGACVSNIANRKTRLHVGETA